MKYPLTTPSFIHDDSDPFKNDLLGRKSFCENLCNIIDNHPGDSGLVISLEEAWGEGKTTFLEMLIRFRSLSEKKTIYINSFENDYFDDSFTQICSELSDQSKKDNTISDIAKGAMGRAISAAGQVAKMAAKVGINYATLNLVSGIEGIQNADKLAELLGDAAAEHFEKKIEGYQKYKDDVAILKENLYQFALECRNATSSPLVVIIDELDRCKPTYAINMIESIKHFFSVKNVVFILSFNPSQLNETIKCIYGSNVNAGLYIQKFINLSCRFPQPKIGEASALKKFTESKISNRLGEHQNDTQLICDSVSSISTSCDLSLRDIEKICLWISILYSAIPQNYLKIPHLIVFLCFIKVRDPDLCSAIRNGTISWEELHKKISHLGFDRNEIGMTRFANKVIPLLQQLTVDKRTFENIRNANGDAVKYLVGVMDHYNSDREFILKYHIDILNTFKIEQ